ncbi:MAG: tRNA (adenosine(37)-N6)-threonylcarbamoyltransferase complex ATPase subunit type 1 TsaE, partial [Patescibacteria group bacterium]
METTIITTDICQTKKIASRLAKEIIHTQASHARVIALSGDLGSGKTTFTQGFARMLGIKEKIQSPTFVLMKIYLLNARKN